MHTFFGAPNFAIVSGALFSGECWALISADLSAPVALEEEVWGMESSTSRDGHRTPTQECLSLCSESPRPQGRNALTPAKLSWKSARNPGSENCWPPEVPTSLRIMQALLLKIS